MNKVKVDYDACQRQDIEAIEAICDNGSMVLHIVLMLTWSICLGLSTFGLDSAYRSVNTTTADIVVTLSFVVFFVILWIWSSIRIFKK